jgi:leucyl/phenylalanyl-tRNA--protein transferase
MDMIFPNPRHASIEGLLAFGGDLSPNRLLTAYRKGIFPWYNADDPILWWSPDPRMVLYPKDFKLSKSFRRVLRNGGFTVTFDQRFPDVIHYCGTVPRKGQKGTWLINEMQHAYIELHKMGFAHSVEVYYEGELVGGLYGVAMGKAFFGESMFAHRDDASKVAFVALAARLERWGFYFIDSQVYTDHLARFGAHHVPRDTFLHLLQLALHEPTRRGSWTE